MKTCSRCKQCRPISNYSKKQSQPDGLYPQCSQCKSIGQAKYRSKNKDVIVAQQKIYRDLHRDAKRAKQRRYRAKLPIWKFGERIRKNIGNGIRKTSWSTHTKTEDILGCSFYEFKLYIERHFAVGMSWDNRSEWHLDHIIPTATALSESDVLSLNHYSNFQPLWADDNLSKGDSLNWQKCPIKYPNQI